MFPDLETWQGLFGIFFSRTAAISSPGVCTSISSSVPPALFVSLFAVSRLPLMRVFVLRLDHAFLVTAAECVARSCGTINRNQSTVVTMYLGMLLTLRDLCIVQSAWSDCTSIGCTGERFHHPKYREMSHNVDI